MSTGADDENLDAAAYHADGNVAVQTRDERQSQWRDVVDTAADVVARVRRPRPIVLAALLIGAAAWGILVDGSLLPVLQPTGSSTIFQASTAAVFAVIGILFGPLAGALGGLIRDGLPVVLTLMLHPAIVTHPDFLQWLGRGVMDILEDVVLGWVPGLVALRTRRLGVLTMVAAVTTWLSLPFRLVGDTLIDGHASQLWTALTTPLGDWNEPVDPALAVYALVTAAMVALALTRCTARPRVALLIGVAYVAGAALLIALGGHV